MPILTVVLLVITFMFTYFLVPVLHTGYLHYYTALSKFVQFVKDRVRLLEWSPASCLALRDHCEEKREKFVTRRINKKSPSHFHFDTCRHSVKFWKVGESIFFSFGWMKNSFSRGKTSLFERNTILSHLPGTLKVFWWLIHPFLFNNITLFISRSGWILASKMLASFSR